MANNSKTSVQNNSTTMSNNNTKTSSSQNNTKSSATTKTNESGVRTGTTKPTPANAPSTNKTIPQSGKATQSFNNAKQETSAKSDTSSKPTTSSNVQAKPSNKPNNKTEFAQDMTKLDDVAIISDVLSSQKGLVKRYGDALTEISCDKLRKLVTTSMSEAATDQFDAFLYMKDRNQYPVENAPPEKVTEAKEKFKFAKEKMSK